MAPVPRDKYIDLIRVYERRDPQAVLISGGSSYEATEAGHWPSLTCHFGKTHFLSENEIKFVSPYMSVIIRGECLAH